MIHNIHKLFYKDYYNGVDFRYIFQKNGEGTPRITQNNLIKTTANKLLSNNLIRDELIDNFFKVVAGRERKNFQARILYPGLVTGVGLTHDSKNIKGGYNLGMHFDYIYGMPIVYASSIKGVLRSYFKDFCIDDGVPPEDMNDLYEAIFNGNKKVGNKYEPMSIYERDIFFDAVIVGKDDKAVNVLEDDSITPHGDNPLKNPIPIQMLKIASGCILEFRFILNDSDINGKTYTVDFKNNLFIKILTTVGIGAKTNVGYGQLEEVKK